jgi:hypothetical protein
VYRVEAQSDTLIGDLATDFFEERGWSSRDQAGQPQRSVVERVDPENPEITNRLQGDLSLFETGVSDDDTLRVLPESVAGCFPKSTRILLANGRSVPIESVTIGEELMSWDMIRNKPDSTAVTLTHEEGETWMLQINEKLTLSHSQPVFTSGDWKLAGQIQIGEEILHDSGEMNSVYDIRPIQEPLKAFHLSTASNSPFFAEEVLVHSYDLKVQAFHLSNRKR